MADEHFAADDPLTDKERRVGHALVELNERIARLAISLGARLESEADVQRILHRETEYLQPTTGAESSGGDSDGRRHHREWEELHGLLNMRCDLMAHTLDDLGLDATRRLTTLVEQQLAREGFEPDSDGFLMHRWLNRLEDGAPAAGVPHLPGGRTPTDG